MTHDTDSLDCPCGPEYFFPCDEEHDGDETCWKCAANNGLLPITREEAGREEASCLIVHREDA